MNHRDITTGIIKGVCTEKSYERGIQYYKHDSVLSVRMRDNVIRADVEGTDLYAVTIDLDSGGMRCRCTCPYDWDGYCKHIVSVLLYVRDHPRKLERDEEIRHDNVTCILDEATAEQIRDFLEAEMEDNEELLERFADEYGIEVI